MKSSLLVFVTLTLCATFSGRAGASAAMNTCNAANECRANVVTIYSNQNNGFIVLAGHILPSICTSAAWGYYWALDLTNDADRARYATALSAFLSGQPVELRTYDATCHVVTVGLGE